MKAIVVCGSLKAKKNARLWGAEFAKAMKKGD
jgi:hypothetical protein